LYVGLEVTGYDDPFHGTMQPFCRLKSGRWTLNDNQLKVVNRRLRKCLQVLKEEMIPGVNV